MARQKVMPEISKSPPKAESLSLSEMMRIMDVATEMRTQRETVEKEFAVADTRRMLREKLLQTTAITGERVTEAEVDAAIESYFSTMYVYREPKGSLTVWLARIYVQRGHLIMLTLLALTLAGTGWWFMNFATTKFSHTARTSRKVLRLETTIKSDLTKVRAVARETSVDEDLNKWEAEANVAREQQDAGALESIEKQASDLASRLNEAYEVRIFADPEQKSGFTQSFKDDKDQLAYYLIVTAKNEQGQSVRRTIDDSQTSKPVSVERWAEQVPKDVYERIAADKKADGILNETLFSEKQRGYRNEQIRLRGTDGNPVKRLGQITEW